MLIQYWQPIPTQHYMLVVSKHHPNIGATIVANIVLMFAVNTNPILRVNIDEMLGQYWKSNIHKIIFSQCWTNIGCQYVSSQCLANVDPILASNSISTIYLCWFPISFQYKDDVG